MTIKTWINAVLEVVTTEKRADPAMIWVFELPPGCLDRRTAGGQSGNRVRPQAMVNTGIDENWMASAVLGAGLAGSRTVTYVPYPGAGMPSQLIQNHAGKLRHMTGGKASMPVVFVMEMTGQTPGFAGQHSDDEIDSTCMHTPGVRTVRPPP